MALPQGYYPVVLPPDPEWLGQAYLTPYMNSVAIRTRNPDAKNTQAYADAYIRIEAGDSRPVPCTYGAAWDTDFLLHSYSPNEVEASQNSQRSIGLVAAATGLSVVNWYIIDVVNVLGGRRLSDPEVPANIVRYRSAVTWRVAGQPLTT